MAQHWCMHCRACMSRKPACALYTTGHTHVCMHALTHMGARTHARVHTHLDTAAHVSQTYALIDASATFPDTLPGVTMQMLVDLGPVVYIDEFETPFLLASADAYKVRQRTPFRCLVGQYIGPIADGC